MKSMAEIWPLHSFCRRSCPTHLHPTPASPNWSSTLNLHSQNRSNMDCKILLLLNNNSRVFFFRNSISQCYILEVSYHFFTFKITSLKPVLVAVYFIFSFRFCYYNVRDQIHWLILYTLEKLKGNVDAWSSLLRIQFIWFVFIVQRIAEFKAWCYFFFLYFHDLISAFFSVSQIYSIFLLDFVSIIGLPSVTFCLN